MEPVWNSKVPSENGWYWLYGWINPGHLKYDHVPELYVIKVFHDSQGRAMTYQGQYIYPNHITGIWLELKEPKLPYGNRK